nr:hypothetical protein [uncultured Campylobacter sp.]
MTDRYTRWLFGDDFSKTSKVLVCGCGGADTLVCGCDGGDTEVCGCGGADIEALVCF